MQYGTKNITKNNLEANITLIHQDLTTLKPGLTLLLRNWI